MSPDDDNLDQPLVDLLAALDASLADGVAPDAAEPDLPPDQLQLYRLARKSLFHLEQTWPRTEPPEAAVSFNLFTGAGRLGKFQTHRELGRGGSGIVFHATDTTTGREVALKLPRLDALLNAELRERFVSEARMTTSLDHPGLVRIFETGEIGAVCYIASEFAGETTLEQWLESHREPMPVRTAAAVVAALARGVEYLHDHHILHRDIKPSNIMLSPATGRATPEPDLATVGIPRLTDFGLAKLFDVATPGSPTMGASGGLVLGTAEYMAPEQADARPEKLGRPTDVYGLGAVLYELLAGHPPFRGRNKFDTLQKTLSEQPACVRRQRKGVPRDLEAICLKCLEKHSRHRYATAGQLAEDLRRFLAGQRPLARPTPWWRHALRWAKRRPAVAAMLAASGVIVPALLVAWVGYGLYRQAEAETERSRLESARETERNRLDAAWRARDKAVELCGRGEVGEGMLWMAQTLATALPNSDDLQHLLRLDLDAWRTRLPILTGTLEHTASVRSAQFGPDGQLVLTIADDETVRLWDSATGECLEPALEHCARVLAAKFDADGQTVATLCDDGSIRIWNAATRELVDCVTATTRSKAELLWEFELGRPSERPLADVGSIWLLRASPDRQHVLTANHTNAVRLWRSSTAELVGNKFNHKANIYDAAFNHDGTLVVTAGDDKLVRFWDPQRQVEHRPPIEHSGTVRSVAFDPTGHCLAIGGHNGFCLRDCATHRLLAAVPNQGLVRLLVFSQFGRRLASGFGDHSVRVWTLPPPVRPQLVHPLADASSHATHDGVRRMPLGVSGITAIAFHPSGLKLYSSGIDDGVRCWDVDSGEYVGLVARHRDVVSHLAVNPTGGTLLTASYDKTVRQWDLVTGREVGPPIDCDHIIGGVAFDTGGSSLATGTTEFDHVQIRNTTDGRFEELGPVNGVFELAFSPDCNRVLAASRDRLYSFDRSGEPCRSAPHETFVHTVAHHPRGQCFVTGGGDGKLRWWNASTLVCEACVQAHNHRVQRAVFSHRGDVLATVGWDDQLRFWDSRTRMAIGPAITLAGAGRSVAFQPNGRMVAVGDKTGRINFAVEPVAGTETPEQLLHWVCAATGTELAPDNTTRALGATAWRTHRREFAAFNESRR